MGRPHLYLILLFCLCAGNYRAQFLNVSSQTSLQLYNAVDALYGGGVSFYDFNDDGWDDITGCVKGDSVQFFVNNGGTFTRMEIIPNDMDAKHPLWLDYDNDGDNDFLFTRDIGSCKLYRNDGWPNFTDVTDDLNLPMTEARSFGVSCADYDDDGYLDIYVCNYNWQDDITNWLFHNNGDGTFTEVSATAGVSDDDLPTFQSVWFDYDFDGLIDLYVVNDKNTGNGLYRNLGDGTFEDVSAETGAGVALDGMCASIADYDRDGDWDIYITNEISGNKLLNFEDGLFTDMAAQAGVATANVGWGGLWIDEDRDGFDDLHVATAAVIDGNQNYFFQNNQNGSFSSGISSLGLSDDDYMSHSNAEGDYNNDLVPDFVVGNLFPTNAALYRNNSGNGGSIKVSLTGVVSNHHAIGSLIEYFAGANSYMTISLCGENYLGQNSQHFVLSTGEASLLDSLVVHWPSGWTDTYYNLSKGQSFNFVEGDTFQPIVVQTGVLCSGSSVVLDGGDFASWEWNNGETTRYIEVSAPGLYWVNATNSVGLTANAEITVVQYPAPLVESIVTPIHCHDDNDATITLSLTNGEVASVIWSNEATDMQLTNLPGATYEWELTDANGCQASGQIEIINPEELVAVVESDNVLCNGDDSGNVVVEVTGGTGTIEVIWPDSIDPDALFAGEYEVTVSDGNQCQLLLDVVITQPPAIEYELTIIPACTGASGSASLEAWGGAGEIEINWGGVNPEELFPGVYSVDISDENNCSVLLEFEMISIEPITAEVSVLNANDGNNGSALVTPSGGQPPYDYLWSTGSIFATVNGLGQGTYTCTITDDIGCEIVVEVVIIDTQVNTVVKELSALYPNPFGDYLIVPAAACSGELKDLAGRTVVSSIFGGSKSRIDTSALSPGLYLWVSDAGKQLLIKE